MCRSTTNFRNDKTPPVICSASQRDKAHQETWTCWRGRARLGNWSALNTFLRGLLAKAFHKHEVSKLFSSPIKQLVIVITSSAIGRRAEILNKVRARTLGRMWNGWTSFNGCSRRHRLLTVNVRFARFMRRWFSSTALTIRAKTL